MWFFTSEICSTNTLNKKVFSFTDWAWISLHLRRAELDASVKIYYESADREGLVSSILIPNYDLNNFFS
jgi:hypothetical protein